MLCILRAAYYNAVLPGQRTRTQKNSIFLPNSNSKKYFFRALKEIKKSKNCRKKILLVKLCKSRLRSLVYAVAT